MAAHDFTPYSTALGMDPVYRFPNKLEKRPRYWVLYLGRECSKLGEAKYRRLSLVSFTIN